MNLRILVSLLALSACGTTTAQQQSLVAGATTLATVAAANNTTVAQLVTKGALFCQKVDPLAPLVVALANASGAPINVTNQTATAVATACAAIQAIPVSPPANPATVPVVTTTAAH